MKHKAAHKALVDLKYATFREFISMPLHGFDQMLFGRSYPCFQFATRTHPWFSDWYFRFYQSGKKVVPMEIAEHKTPLALTVWFMDDGAADHAGVTFQTHNFSYEEVCRLSTVLEERFGLVTTVRSNRGRWIIYVVASSVSRLEEGHTTSSIEGVQLQVEPPADTNPVETARWPLAHQSEGDDTVRPHR